MIIIMPLYIYLQNKCPRNKFDLGQLLFYLFVSTLLDIQKERKFVKKLGFLVMNNEVNCGFTVKLYSTCQKKDTDFVS